MFQYILDIADCVELRPFAGIVLSATRGEKMTLSIVDLEPHAVVEEHSHPHEQIGYMVEGEAEFVIEGESFRVRAGQIWRLPGGVRHKVIAGDRPTRAIDVFYPVREDFEAAK